MLALCLERCISSPDIVLSAILVREDGGGAKVPGAAGDGLELRSPVFTNSADEARVSRLAETALVYQKVE